MREFLQNLRYELTPGRIAAAVFALAAGLLWLLFFHQSPIEDPGWLEPPLQTPLSPFVRLEGPTDAYSIEGTDEYDVRALVISREPYWQDEGAEISPVDFLLGWGPCATDPNLNSIRWSQGGRWANYRYDYDKVTIDGTTIARNSANTHIIPDPKSLVVERTLKRIRRGDVVRLKGYLVRITRSDGWRWNSSRTRNDTGGGACEVFYVTEAEITNREE